MPREARIDYPGALHHVIGRGIERSKIFEEDTDKEKFLLRLKLLLDKSGMQCYAWCIMDNHFHLLLLTGKTPLSEFMRKLLTGYAVNYNKEHKRIGHLFQNRYKSILCDRDEYLLPLIRYIHLNPVRVKKVEINKLPGYKWTSHKEMINKQKKEDKLIEAEEVLGYFGKRRKEAIARYVEYVREGKELREDYGGGGLIRRAGGIKEILKRKAEERELYDERILGSGGFVEETLRRMEQEEDKYPKIRNIEELIGRISRYYGIEVEEIIETRKKKVREARSVLVYLASKYLKETGVKIGKLLGVGKGAISIAKEKGRNFCKEKGIEGHILQ